MSVVTKVGTFTINATGSQAVAHGLGSTPALVFLTVIEKGTDGFLNPAPAHNQRAQIGGGVFNSEGQQYAWSNVTRQTGFTGASVQRVAGMQHNNRCLKLLANIEGGVVSPTITTELESSFVSVDGTNFTINNLIVGGGYLVSYYAIGGNDIADTAIGMANPANALGVETQIATGFEPEFVMFLDHQGTQPHIFGLGFCTQCGYIQYSMSAEDKDNDGFADAMGIRYHAYGYNTWGVAAINTYTDGFTFTPVVQPTSNPFFGYVAISGGSHHVAPVVGTSTPVTVVTGFETTGLMSISNGAAGAAPYTAADTVSETMGFYDGTSQRVTSYTHHFGSSYGQAYTSDDGFGVARVNNSPSLESLLVGTALNNNGYSLSITSGNGRYSTVWAIGPGAAGAGGCGDRMRASFDLVATVRPTAGRGH